MASSRLTDTDDGTIPLRLRRFARNRLLEAAGLCLLAGVAAATVCLATWNVADPSLSHATDAAAANWLGAPGSIVADELMRFFGLGVIAVVAVPLYWASRLLSHATITRLVRRFAAWPMAALGLAALLSLAPAPSSWPLGSGLGGSTGDLLSKAVLWLAGLILPQPVAVVAALVLFAAGFGLAALYATGIPAGAASRAATRVADTTAAGLDSARGLIGHLRLRRRARNARRELDDEDAAPTTLSGALAALRGHRSEDEDEPILADHDDTRREPRLTGQAGLRRPPTDPDDFDPDADEDDLELDQPPHSIAVAAAAAPIRQARRQRKPAAIAAVEDDAFELPSLSLLAEPKQRAGVGPLSPEALEQNARMLEGVLDDFGVRGEIINVRPGPVVTLYELEPAPGIKSSRVIGLADDIARSMCAISVRVAVVPGRNVIGIELPNVRRETVFLREMLGSQDYQTTTQNLCMALGKDIGGAPAFADLARMPHLLIAGTTGSGKSVGINTMILSLLYRMTPEQCRLIMIDPKMLELSVYEGIPHLLAPVVTDPRKAVVALKWAVREMEDRYRKMSKLGVRNIEGYNARARQAATKGETFTRTVQTGFDPETGRPVYEEERMDLAPLPFIVVIIDEMADLMLVAGKDIEGAVQRLAQMARAAGIHVIMATQRPSVDVITGTIKANFPTRVSFQVTSKIDSRTILGEQGAEQLLGQGDMLYMAGGGRISRLHGPFVSDDEVEKIVAFLKTQGSPQYVDAVTEDGDEDDDGAGGDDYGAPGGGSGDDLYDQAVAVVLRDRKVSTSYIQRRLAVGYNKAASLIERMENEGVISAPNHAGKRDILVGGEAH